MQSFAMYITANIFRVIYLSNAQRPSILWPYGEPENNTVYDFCAGALARTDSSIIIGKRQRAVWIASIEICCSD